MNGDTTLASGSRHVVDLRSDTLTLPTRAMRLAMAEAELGDDVFGEDPTVRRLEARVAEILGKEAALFVPSGTMSNQVAVHAHTHPGDEMVLDANAHIYYFEAGGPAVLSGVQCRCLNGNRGMFTAADVEAVIRPNDPHFPRTRLVCLEQTHNRGGGSVWKIEAIKEIAAFARARGLRMHLDGARLWNASVATGIPERTYAECFDSVSVCFSKGLGAPVGSALAGEADFIAQARRFRKMIGGGMRQAGILAAGALYALDHHRERLARDHDHARKLSLALARMPGVLLDPATVQTNIIIFRVSGPPAATWVEQLKQAGVLVLATGPDSIRAVLHLNISPEQVAEAELRFLQVAKNLAV